MRWSRAWQSKPFDGLAAWGDVANPIDSGLLMAKLNRFSDYDNDYDNDNDNDNDGQA